MSQLISQVAAEHQLTLDGDFQQFRAQPTLEATPAQAAPEDDVEARLNRLLGGGS